MLFIRKKTILQKIIISVLLICFVAVVSGLGALSLPKQAEAQWFTTMISNVAKWLEGISVAIFKGVLIPILEEILVKCLTGSDMPLYMSDLSTFLDQVGGQIIDNIFLSLGIDLCADISVTLSFAIEQIYTPSFQARCSFRQMLENWEENMSWDNFEIIMSQENNELGILLAVEAEALGRIAKEQSKWLEYAKQGSGFLPVVECGKRDLNGDGVVDNADCEVNIPAAGTKEAILSTDIFAEGTKAIAGTTVLSELLALAMRVVTKVVRFYAAKGLSKLGGLLQEATSEE